MGKVVTRVDAPLISHSMMVHALDPIHHRVSHIHIWMRHIDLGPQHLFTVGKLARPHSLKKVQTLRNRSLAIGTRPTRLFQSTAILTHFFV